MRELELLIYTEKFIRHVISRYICFVSFRGGTKSFFDRTEKYDLRPLQKILGERLVAY
jgi:hypothetical protein